MQSYGRALMCNGRQSSTIPCGSGVPFAARGASCNRRILLHLIGVLCLNAARAGAREVPAPRRSRAPSHNERARNLVGTLGITVLPTGCGLLS